MKFSVLMSIYENENEAYFHRAMKSIWNEQTLKPDQIVLVLDGPITEKLNKGVCFWKKILDDILFVVELEHNVGLGEALNIGLKNCKNELVARMDADDISIPNRFETQVKFLQNNNVNIVGSWVSEFDKDEKIIISSRILPISHKEIYDFSKARNPMNHPTVMFYKSSIENVGGYKAMICLEDYYLWVRMLHAGSVFANIPKCLVIMRTGYMQLQRRSGIKYALSEYQLQKKFLEIGFIKRRDFFKSFFTRILIRLLPKFLLKVIYSKLRSS